MLWFWSTVGLLTLVAFLFLRFRPLLSLALGVIASLVAARMNVPALPQILVCAGCTLLLDLVLKPVHRRLHRVGAKPEDQFIVGCSGKLRDVLDRRSGLFLMNSEGRDWVAVPESPGCVALGDIVEVVALSGKKVVVRKRPS